MGRKGTPVRKLHQLCWEDFASFTVFSTHLRDLYFQFTIQFLYRPLIITPTVSNLKISPLPNGPPLILPISPLPSSQIDASRAKQNAGGTWQGAVNPTYLKQDGDMAFFAVGMALISFAGLRLANGYWHMAHGTGKIE